MFLKQFKDAKPIKNYFFSTFICILQLLACKKSSFITHYHFLRGSLKAFKIEFYFKLALQELKQAFRLNAIIYQHGSASWAAILQEM